MSVFLSGNSRRVFIKQASLALLGTSLTAPSILKAQDFLGKKQAAPKIILGVQSYTYRNFDLETTLKKMKELNVTQAEFYQKHIPANSTPEQLKAILNLCKEYGVKPVAFGVQKFTKDHDANKKMFDFGKAIGITAISADPDPDSFESLDKLCAEYKIAIAIHPHGPAGKGQLHRWYSAELIMAGVKDHHPLIGSCLDTGHLIRSAQLGKNLDPATEVRTMGKRNFGMHLKDHDNKKQTDVVFGKGVLDVDSVLKALSDVGFSGMISIEYEANPQDPSPDLKACIDIFNTAVKKIS